MLYFLRGYSPRPLLPCFSFLLLCSVFKVQTRIRNVPSKLNNARIKNRVTTFDGIKRRASRAAVIAIQKRSDLGMLRETFGLARSP